MKVFWLFSFQILFSLHSSVLSNNFVLANAFSVPWDPFFPWWHLRISSALNQPKLQGISSPADGWWALEVETGGCSSLQGGDALPEKWETQVSFDICVLKSQFFGLNKTSRHRYMSIFHSLPFFEPLHWSEFDVSLFHLFDRLSLATWLDRLPHVETPFHGWNMLKCCFGLSSFEWPP